MTPPQLRTDLKSLGIVADWDYRSYDRSSWTEITHDGKLVLQISSDATLDMFRAIVEDLDKDFNATNLGGDKVPNEVWVVAKEKCLFDEWYLKNRELLTLEVQDLLPTRKECPAFSVTIFMAGDLATAKAICRAECDREGLCVTVEPTTYIYTGGSEDGFRVGLINYARFPTTREKLLDRARKLARLLLEKCGQTSFSIVTPETSYYYSRRGKD